MAPDDVTSVPVPPAEPAAGDAAGADAGAGGGEAPGNPAPVDIYAPATRIPPPAVRPLKAFAYDPSHGRRLGNCMTVAVRYEKLAPGPVGDRFAVVDYDGAQECTYEAIDLDHPSLLIRGGMDPSEVDPRFHQQMVYAVASETLERFEAALGRRVHWRAPYGADGEPIYGVKNRLFLHPHAMRDPNAFYSPDVHGILFGYFQASKTDPGRNLPGQTVFTCLSHDIVAHETTHAIVDGIRAYFMEPTNIDVPAFHEAFADLAALFRHFSHQETLIETLQKTGGRLYDFHLRSGTADAVGGAPDGGQDGSKDPTIQADIARRNPLIELATQFGEASGMHKGLRSGLGTPPDSKAILTTVEAHDRGSILVAAVFDAFFTVYLRRAAPLLRIYRAGGRDTQDVPTSLAELLAKQASRTAETFFTLCARSLDYCPPVDITFGDFLRALMTADKDFYPDDTDGIRDALMEAFRLRGIVADDATSYSEDSLCWPELEKGVLTIEGLKFGDPNGLDAEEKKHNGDRLRAWAKANAALLGFEPGPDIDVPSFHPMFRVAQDGTLKIEMVVELVQTHPGESVSTLAGSLPMRSGVTLIVAKPQIRNRERALPYVRFAIAKGMSEARQERQRITAATSNVAARAPDGRLTINFGLVHGGA